MNPSIYSDEINFYQEATFNAAEVFPATNPKPETGTSVC